MGAVVSDVESGVELSELVGPDTEVTESSSSGTQLVNKRRAEKVLITSTEDTTRIIVIIKTIWNRRLRNFT